MLGPEREVRLGLARSRPPARLVHLKSAVWMTDKPLGLGVLEAAADMPPLTNEPELLYFIGRSPLKLCYLRTGEVHDCVHYRRHP
jgi:hypothetical protein